MRALFILAEGPTEREFIKNLLKPYLATYDIYNIHPVLLKTSSKPIGGDIRYSRYKENAEKLLKSQHDIIVTSFIDLYALRNDFPSFADAILIANRKDRITFLEEAIYNDINNTRMIPYIQLHEFEALLFSGMLGFEKYITQWEAQGKKEVERLVNLNDPESINDGHNTAPSKRLKQLIPEYQKVTFGNLIAMAIGIETIMAKCPRFKAWIEKLIAAMLKEDYFD